MNIFLILGLMFLISFSTRILPFLFSGFLKKSRLIQKLSLMLPGCILILLIGHGLEHTSFLSYPFGIPEMSGIALTVLAHLLLRSTMVSILAGLGAFMALVYLM